MRTISLLIVHCSATPEGRDYTVQDIDRWHRARGWSGIGYHYVIYRDGTIHAGRPEWQVGAHCRNHNAHSIGICYIGGLSAPADVGRGGLPKDTRTPQQKAALRELLRQLKLKYATPPAPANGCGRGWPLIFGHNTFDPSKACPCFDASAEYADL